MTHKAYINLFIGFTGSIYHKLYGPIE